MSGSADVQGLHIRALADLWTFLVAHSDTEALKAAQSQLRDLLHQALPLFKQWSQQATVNDLAVQSSLGVFKAQMAGGSLTLAGLSGDGRAELSTTVDGLAIPEGLVPDWASDLIPSTVALRQTLSGYRLAEAADLAISSFDLNRAELYPPDTSERMKALVGPLDKMTLEVAPSHLASKLLDITVQGTVRFAQPVPNVAMTIRATGLDNAIKAIQAKAGGDPLASQVTGVMVLAKGFGKADPDGALTWVVAKSDAGGITINGIALPGGAN